MNLNYNYLQTILQIALTFFSVFATLSGLGLYFVNRKIDDIKTNKNSYTGVIEDQSYRKESNNLFSTVQVQIGKNGPTFQGNLDILFKNQLDLDIKIIDNKIKVTGSVSDATGETIAKIVDNEWKVNPNKSFDRNFTKDTLEVIDNKQNVVLQIQLKDNVVHLQGVFYNPKTNYVWMIAQIDRAGSPDAYFEKQKFGSNKFNFGYSIKPIFKYPSQLHFGELE